ncbi:flavin monoamine oxidase family protein [Ochrobactrum teleogrylli]|uniref:FAD-dependent oxidoreductase n=1 Tax=Ochrobactrum teleogrylli TaxID=2479765 RepID=A0ABY2Y5U1_9HYPH|nr:FAD-dependent oxidoreductase [[Ochrobactrum] teleogrylli]TNV16139.1 FAD-dependent oxidoreductase [[Ochrobactrum] teleogrylli]
MTGKCAVVGGGVAGITAVRELRRRGVSDVTIFEKTDRIGGRVFSRSIDDTGGVAELGAGRFNPSRHIRLKKLVDKYGLATKPFSFPLQPLQYGLHQHSLELLKSFCSDLGDLRGSLSPMESQRLTLEEAALSSIGRYKFECLVTMTGYDTLRNPDLTFDDGYELLQHHPETCGLFQGELSEWLAFSHGFSALTAAMVSEIERDVTISLEHELTEVMPRNGGGYELCFETPHGLQSQGFDKVVFAIPIWSIQKLRGLNMSAFFRKSISAVPLTKAYFSYADRWWAGTHIEGRCVSSDTIFRKAYFPADANNLLIYADGESAVLLEKALKNDRNVHSAFIEAMLDHLPFGLVSDAIPKPTGSGHQFWDEGISFWKSGVNFIGSGFWSIDDDACVCSDLFTQHLGWVEGALESAERGVAHLYRNQSCAQAVAAVG